MSLLNQVLRDLDAQEAPAGAPDLKLAQMPPQVDAPLLEATAPPNRWLLWTGLVVTVLAVAYGLVRWDTQTKTERQAETIIDDLPVAAETEGSLPLTDVVPAVPEGGKVDQGQALPASAELAPVQVLPKPTMPEQPVAMPQVAAAPLPVHTPAVSAKKTPALPPKPAAEVAKTPPSAGESKVDYVPLKITPRGGVAKPVKKRIESALSPVDLARSAIASGQLSLAEQTLRDELKTHPDNRVANELLVGVLLRGNRPQEVLAQIAVSLQHLRQHAGLQLIRARTLLETGQAVQAERALQQLLRDQPQLLDAKRLLAGMLQQQGRADEAMPFYQQLTNTRQAKAQDWLGLALSTESLDHRVAVAAYRQALALPGLTRATRGFIQRRIEQLP